MTTPLSSSSPTFNSSDKTPRVSIMIPMYNAAAYIERCLQSIFAQDYPNLEVIIVDDCSTDDSAALTQSCIDRYQAQEYTLFLTHHTNRGSATARLTALYAATGDWLLWVDSDDYWDTPHVVSQWIARAIETQAEVVVCNYWADYPRKNIAHNVPHITDGKAFALALLRGETPGYLHNKLIKKSAFQERAMLWIEGLNVLEDLGSLVPFFYRTSSVTYVDNYFYHYVQYNAQAYTKTVNTEKLFKMKELIHTIEIELASERTTDKALDQALCSAYWTVARMQLEHAPLRDYSLITRALPLKKSLLWKLPLSSYDKLMLQAQATPILSPLGYAMSRFKLWVKKKLRY